MYLPQRIVIDGLFVYRPGLNYLFNKVNPDHTDSVPCPVVTPQEIIVKDFDCVLGGKLYVSQNKDMFNVKITQE